jgi:uncharacterized protein (TIGR00159 family)
VGLQEAIEGIRNALEALRGSPFGWLVELADILILAYLIYQLALLIRGTRAAQVMTGVMIILASWWLAGVLQLLTLQRFLGYLLYWIPFAMIVIFQNTIRRVLTRFGRNPFARKLQAGQAEAVVKEVVSAASALASRRIGGLIVIEREQGLRGLTETGMRVDSRIAYDVMVAIFQPGSPLHDGAIVIREGRIHAAGCFLPLSQQPQHSKELGSRHRAAIGVTEESDSVCVVVSEERGTISVAFEGGILRDLDANRLRDYLREKLEIHGKVSEKEPDVEEAGAVGSRPERVPDSARSSGSSGSGGSSSTSPGEPAGGAMAAAAPDEG